MTKDGMSKKIFNLTHLGIKIVAGILLAIFLIFKSRGWILPFIVCTVFLIIFISYNRLLVYFHKKGFYTSLQAAEFYKKCREQKIPPFQGENFEKAKDVYFLIFETDIYSGEGSLLDHMENIYNIGKEITEK